MSDRIDQIVFRWRARSQATGHDGVGPDATSLPAAAVPWWDERLALRITRASGRNDRPSLAYLRVEGNGVVLSSIAHRDTARLYCKQVLGGRGEHLLSPEEDEAIRRALAGERGTVVLED